MNSNKKSKSKQLSVDQMFANAAKRKRITDSNDVVVVEDRNDAEGNIIERRSTITKLNVHFDIVIDSQLLMENHKFTGSSLTCQYVTDASMTEPRSTNCPSTSSVSTTNSLTGTVSSASTTSERGDLVLTGTLPNTYYIR